jgi:hypothetical protein
MTEFTRTVSDTDPLSERLLRLWHLPWLNSAWFLCLVQIVLCCACALRALVGLRGMRSWVHDAFVLLDGAWRVRNGQVPYNDFSTDVGPLVHLLNAFGLLLAHNMPVALAYAQAIVGLIVGVWAFSLSRRRLSPIGSTLLTVLLVLLALGPFDVGNAPTMTSPAMVYNRYGFALVALGILEAVCPRRPFTKLSEFVGGLSTGVIAILLLFIKVSYFPGLGLLLLLLIGCRRQTLLRWTGLLTGACAAFAPFLMYMRWTLVPMWVNLQMLAGAKHVLREWFLVEAVYGAAIPLAILAFIAFRLLSRHGAPKEGRSVLTVGLAVAAVGMCFVVANFPGSRLPLNAVAAVILVDLVETRFSARPRTETLMRCGVLLWGAWFIFTSLFLDATGLAYSVYARMAVTRVPGSTFSAPTLAGFSTFDVGYVEFVNDGLALARQHRKPDDTIMSLDFSNPFSYTFRVRPARGGTPIGLQFDTNFNDKNHIEPDRLFGHASLVMIPQPQMFSDWSLAANIPRLYGPWLQQHFHLIGETAFWRAYRNNSVE